MKLFKCENCGQTLHFSNRQCVQCGLRLGYAPDNAQIYSLEPVDGLWQPTTQAARYRFCANAETDACNWLVSADIGDLYCRACRHNHIIPDLSIDANLANWLKVERAKHHLFYSLLRLRLPLATRVEQPNTGLAFDFLADPSDTGDSHEVMTGHDDGLITINLAEADDAVREQRRVSMGEPYRTLLGHFRHEVGHYFWDRLIDGTDRLQEFRNVFGDETADYDTSLQTYYANGPQQNWEEHFVSAYASAHPWEDFAESWAHYLHMIDTIEMAGAYGLQLRPLTTQDGPVIATDRLDPHLDGTIDELVEMWLPITVAVTSLNRCLGQPDFYPFVLTPTVIGKLGFIHDTVRTAGAMQAQPQAMAAQ